MKKYTVKMTTGRELTGVISVNNERGITLETEEGRFFIPRNIIEGVVIDGVVHPDSNFS